MSPTSQAKLLLILAACELNVIVSEAHPMAFNSALTLRRRLPVTALRSYGRPSCTRMTSDQSSPKHASPAWERTLLQAIPTLLLTAPGLAIADDGTGYSPTSYYFTLFLFVISFPGIYSQVTRSVKPKLKKKVYEFPGPSREGGRELSAIAGEVMGYMQANNYKVAEAGEVIKFEGRVQGTKGNAAFLVFCVAVSVASLALVLRILEESVFGGAILGNWYFLGCLASPIAGNYYLEKSDQIQEVSVKMVAADDDSVVDMTIMADEKEIERMQEQLELREKGMVFVKGLLSK